MTRKPVHIETLGAFSLRVSGRNVRYGRKAPLHPLKLLKFLVAHGGRELADVEVARAIWPGREAAAAVRSLAVTLHRLRRLIGRPEAIVHRDGRIGLDPRHVWCDAAAFDEMLDESARCDREPHRLDLTARALALYHGDFLSGEPREPWLAPVRARLRERFVLACTAQAERLAAAARWDEARACLDLAAQRMKHANL
ncbi:MAG TPA: BTAD domain-containing putative transcriptional regulator [Usitatibacter sp.]|nr:BTAD domain-containing putative transcriptional regulator [Usitatibacter sp.]